MVVEAAADSIYEGLRALDRRRYLCAMWIVCNRLQAVYEDQLSDAERSLMAATLGAVREAVLAGEVSVDVGKQATDLYRHWQVMAVEQRADVAPGQWNAWAVFRDIASEVAGASQLYEATERVDLAATDRWRESRQWPIYDDPNEEVDESSPMARTLNYLDQAVKGVAGAAELEMRKAGWDPVKIRVQLLG
jgi:hypothetical protein